jgi:hypothetical protein
MKMLVFLYLIFLYLTVFKLVVCIDTADGNSSISCPTWTYRANDSSQCVCGVNLTTAVICDPVSKQVKVRGCHMITFDPARNQTYAGYSFYRCVQHFSKTSTVSPNAHRVNFDMCHQFNRDGLFCGTCKENHYPLVYSYKLNCKLCSDREIRRSVFILFVVAFIPVSIFYGIVLLFKFNANSPSLHGFIFLAQILTQTSNMKIFYTKFDSSRHHEKDIIIVLETLYSIWNLNFFRAFTPDICLRISTLDALLLEYVVAFYPMLLIVATYIATELHFRGYRIITVPWQPFRLCSIYFRKEWNIKSSLIDVFATFLLLSYNRLLDINFSLLMYITPYNPKGEIVGRYVYYDSSKKFYGRGHRLYGDFAALILFFFNVVPFLLLLLYPVKWFQKCLNLCKINKIALHTFVDSFAGCYKDGTEPGTRDCRYFAALSFLLRFANCVSVFSTFDGYYLVIFPIILVCFSTLFISAQPYRSKFSQHNVTTMVFLMISIVLCCCFFGINTALMSYPNEYHSLLIFTFLVASLPLVYITFLVLKWIYDRLLWGGRRLCYLTSRYVHLDDKVNVDSTVHCEYNTV